MRKTFKVLIVDDQELNRHILENVLANIKIVTSGGLFSLFTEEAENGRDALEKLEAAHFHMVISDGNMPIVDGLELLRVIRSSEEDLSKIPFIMISANYENLPKALELGADFAIEKPLEIKCLSYMIEHLLRKSEPT